MAVEIITSFVTLCRLARAEYEAIQSGDEQRIKEAKEQHESYRQFCLRADKMLFHTTKDQL